MPAQQLTQWSLDIRIAFGNAVIQSIDSHLTNPGYMGLYSASDVMLSRVNFTDSCGSVDPLTAVVTLTPDGRDESAAATGVASTLRIFDGYGNEKRSLPCEIGTAPVVGKCIMPTTSVSQGQPVEYNDVVI